MLLSRRLIQDAANHKLETLVRHLGVETEGAFHRALYDAEMAGRVWLAMIEQIADQAELDAVPFELADKLCKAGKAKVHALLQAYVQSGKERAA